MIDFVLEAGGDSTNGYFPGKWEDIGTKHKVYGKTVKAIWQIFVSTGDILGDLKRTWNPSKLGQGELNLIEAMKTQNPSVSYKVIKENLSPSTRKSSNGHFHNSHRSGSSIFHASRENSRSCCLHQLLTQSQ